MIRIGAGGEHAMLFVFIIVRPQAFYCIREYYLEFKNSCSDRYVTPSA